MKSIIIILVLVGVTLANTRYKDGTECKCDSIHIEYTSSIEYGEFAITNGKIIGMKITEDNTQKYNPNECIKTSRDGYIWYIASITSNGYVAMGWQGNGWGNPVNLYFHVLNNKKLGYQKIQCPVKR